MKLCDLMAKFESWCPVATAMDFDNVGLLVGDPDMEIAKAAVALDATVESVAFAKKVGANLLVTHHPIIFRPLKSVTPDKVTWHAMQAGIAVVSMHTNLDVAQGGVNDCLAGALQLTDVQSLCDDGLGRVGNLPAAMDDAQLAAFVKQQLGAGGVRYNKTGRIHTRVAVGGGACGDLWGEALATGATALISGEAKYNDFLDAAQNGICIAAAGHFATEQVVCGALYQFVKEQGIDCDLCAQTDVEEFC